MRSESGGAPKVVVTGATGGLGSDVVASLLRLLPGAALGVAVRRPEALAALGARGVRVRYGDFGDPASLERAFEGSERVLLISTRTPGNGERLQEQKNAIDAVRRSGASHVVYTSVLQRRGSPFYPTEGHLATEEYLASSGLGHTIVRNGHYVENLPMLLGGSLETGILELPPDGPVSWVARADLGEGIARILVAGQPTGSLALTGPEALDFAQVAEIASDCLGRVVERRVISPEAYVERLKAHGMPEGAARMLASGFASRAARELACVDPALEKLVERPRLSVAETLPRLLAPAGRRSRPRDDRPGQPQKAGDLNQEERETERHGGIGLDERDVDQ